jgi:hypothetical protein
VTYDDGNERNTARVTSPATALRLCTLRPKSSPTFRDSTSAERRMWDLQRCAGRGRAVAAQKMKARTITVI